MVRLNKQTKAEGWLQFVTLPDTCMDDLLRDHIQKLPGVELNLFIPELGTEAVIGFTYKKYEFCADNAYYVWRFFVTDPHCPDRVMQEVATHCAGLLGLPA